MYCSFVQMFLLQTRSVRILDAIVCSGPLVLALLSGQGHPGLWFHPPFRCHWPYWLWSNTGSCSRTKGWHLSTYPRRKIPAFIPHGIKASLCVLNYFFESAEMSQNKRTRMKHGDTGTGIWARFQWHLGCQWQLWARQPRLSSHRGGPPAGVCRLGGTVARGPPRAAGPAGMRWVGPAWSHVTRAGPGPTDWQPGSHLPQLALFARPAGIIRRRGITGRSSDAAGRGHHWWCYDQYYYFWR